jgi:hypothetical protein
MRVYACSPRDHTCQLIPLKGSCILAAEFAVIAHGAFRIAAWSANAISSTTKTLRLLRVYRNCAERRFFERGRTVATLNPIALSPAQTALAIGVQRRELRLAIQKNLIPVFKIGNRRRILYEDAIAWVRSWPQQEVSQCPHS